MGAAEWLGLQRVDEGTWVLPVTEGVLAGSAALYGGCATAAALAVGAELCEHTPRWVSTHFTGLARLGTAVAVEASVLSAGRTVTHIAVEGRGEDGRACFSARATFGDRPRLAEASFATPPGVDEPDACEPFVLRVHDGTFASRFEWRLASPDGNGDGRPFAAWWVRAEERPLAGALVGAVLCDYVTYGIGRAARHDVGGLSVDNSVRLHDAGDVDGWALLSVEADSLDGGFGSGSATVWREDGTPVCSGSQTMVLNPWSWRQEGE